MTPFDQSESTIAPNTSWVVAVARNGFLPTALLYVFVMDWADTPAAVAAAEKASETSTLGFSA
jgi:hypothetical protein